MPETTRQQIGINFQQWNNKETVFNSVVETLDSLEELNIAGNKLDSFVQVCAVIALLTKITPAYISI